jgi:putative salt-induced outer membrane protein YdiY
VDPQDAPGLFRGWKGNFDVGLALTAGNTDSVNFAMSLAAERETKRDRLSAYVTQIYAWNSVNGNSNTTANAFRGGLRYDWKVQPRWGAFLFTDIETNDIQGLDFRFSFGGGFNYRLIDKPRKKLDVFAGAAFTREYFESDFFVPPFDPNDLSKNSFEVLFGDEFKWDISDRYHLVQRAALYPNITDLGSFRLNFDVNFAADITRRIAWQNNFSYRLFTNPPPGFETQDLLFTTGIRFKFGR